jgi:hypothetical protein
MLPAGSVFCPYGLIGPLCMAAAGIVLKLPGVKCRERLACDATILVRRRDGPTAGPIFWPLPVN